MVLLDVGIMGVVLKPKTLSIRVTSADMDVYFCGR